MSDVFSTVQDSSTWTDIQGKASRSFGPLFPSMASISKVVRWSRHWCHSCDKISQAFSLCFAHHELHRRQGLWMRLVFPGDHLRSRSSSRTHSSPGVLPPECCNDTLQYLQQRGPSTLFWSSTTGPACTSMPPETHWHECKILVNFFLYLFKAYIKFVCVVCAILCSMYHSVNDQIHYLEVGHGWPLLIETTEVITNWSWILQGRKCFTFLWLDSASGVVRSLVLVFLGKYSGWRGGRIPAPPSV